MFQCDLTRPLVEEVLREIGGGQDTWDRTMRFLLDGTGFPVLDQPAVSFSRDYLRYNLLRKYSGRVNVQVDPADAALQGWLVTEEACGAWNEHRGLTQKHIPLEGVSFEQTTESLIHRARALIASVLGRLDLNEVAEVVRYTSGASSGHKRASGHPYYKYQVRPEVTPSCSLLMVCDMWRTPLVRRHFTDRCWDPTEWVVPVIGGKFSLAPKTWKVHRPIVLEPEGNMRFQAATGTIMRRRFKRRTQTAGYEPNPVSQDLNDQDPNGELAREGSINGCLATIDLASASDSVSLGLVEELLPLEWYEWLLRIRSPYVLLPSGKWHKLEKISSMGNGFTFELESLIFWALGQACVDLYRPSDRRLRVYGDDIVISTEVAQPLIRLLQTCGFSTNVDKTFTEGPFRESCGKHWFNGVDVSPFNIKEPIETEDRYYWFLNTYRQWLEVNGRPLKSYHRCLRIVSNTLASKGIEEMCVVPPGFGFTAGLELPASRARIWYSLRMQGYVFTALLPKRKRHRPNGWAAALCSLTDVGHIRYSTPLISRLDESLDGMGLYIMKGDVSYKRFTRKTSVWVF